MALPGTLKVGRATPLSTEILDEAGKVAADVHSEGDEPLAAEIARRWNAFPGLVGALKTAQWALTTRDTDGQFRATPKMLAEIAAALSRAGVAT